MIVSMTGYHYATQIIGGVEYSLQIKTLNSKILDLSIKSAYEKLLNIEKVNNCQELF